MTETTTKKRRGRPPGKKYPNLMSTSVSEEMEEAVKRVAAEDSTNVSEVVRRALSAYLEDRERVEAQVL